MSPDFLDMLSALSDANADFLVVGAHALAAHGVPRATGDLDLWIRPTLDNARAVHRGLATFGAPLEDLAIEDLVEPNLVFQIGVAPARVDIMTSISGVEFEEAWASRLIVAIDDLEVPVLGRAHFIRNKRACGRPQDLADVARLEALGDES